jgi:Holliday junction DNA helicase RuvA
MITWIHGVLRECSLLTAVVEVHGIGYEIQIPITTAEKLPQIGKEVFLYTVVVYREDSQTLYGFASREDRDLFRTLIEKVGGIGPRTAQNILSRLSATALRNAILNQDTALLSKCQGIGKKTAERLVLELKDKLAAVPATQAPAAGDLVATTSALSHADQIYQDALAALVALGFKPADADKAIRKTLQAQGDQATTESLVKAALRS